MRFHETVLEDINEPYNGKAPECLTEVLVYDGGTVTRMCCCTLGYPGRDPRDVQFFRNGWVQKISIVGEGGGGGFWSRSRWLVFLMPAMITPPHGTPLAELVPGRQ